MRRQEISLNVEKLSRAEERSCLRATAAQDGWSYRAGTGRLGSQYGHHWPADKTSQSHSMETSMETSIETNMERQTEKMAEWDIVTEFIGAELAEFYRESEVSAEVMTAM